MPLLDDVRQAIPFRHYSYQSELTYVGWVERFVRFLKGLGRWSEGRRRGYSGAGNVVADPSSAATGDRRVVEQR
jgi:hypothetical protein